MRGSAAWHAFSDYFVNMATGRKRFRVRLSLGIEFDSSEAKAAFSDRLESLRSLLTPPEQRTLDNHGLLTVLFDYAERSASRSFAGVSRASAGHLPGSTSAFSAGRQSVGVLQTFNSNSGR